jgi:hypothetical protein
VGVGIALAMMAGGGLMLFEVRIPFFGPGFVNG